VNFIIYRGRIFFLLGLLTFILASGLMVACQANAVPTPPPTVPAIALAPCTLTSPGSPMRVGAQCGSLTVYEDRESQQGRTIDLMLAVVPAVSRSPEADPLFFLAGGPGQSALESYPMVHAAFARVNQRRDIVLVDQRGTGSSNPLDCPGGEEFADIDEEIIPWAISCLSGLQADPRFYTTSIAMHDLDDVRDALGYQQINLYGVSYGSRAALTYMRQYPDRVRTAILDGVVPQDEALGLRVARDAQQALEGILSRCRNLDSCRAAFPDIGHVFDELLKDLEAEPVHVVLPHPSSGEIQELTFTPEMMAAAVRLLTYAPETAALLPLLLNSAYAHHDYSFLAAQYLIISDQITQSISTAMSYSVLCSEDLPFIDPEEAERMNAGTYLGDIQTSALFQICQVWPRGDIPPDFKEPVRSDAPVLLLSGEYDPVTPPYKGEQAAQTLPNSLHLVIPGQGHNVIFRGCVPNLVTALIESGSTAGLNTACVQGIQPLPFFVSFSGPAP
jgi:pimeloyl-ACP methyl ester carboxylesterase